MYTLKTKTKMSARWECSKRKSNECSGLSLRAWINDDRNILSSGQNNHPANNEEVSANVKTSQI